MPRIGDVTALARPLEPDDPTNRWIAALALVTAVVGTSIGLFDPGGVPVGSGSAADGPGGFLRTLEGGRFLRALGQGAHGGASVFASWALARELDPDAPRAALLGAVLAMGWLDAVWLTGADAPSLVLAFALLLLLRLVARTVGLPPRPLDAPVLLALTAWAAAATGSWTVAVLGGAALVGDRLLPRAGPGSEVMLASGAVVVAIVVGAVYGAGPRPPEPAWSVAVALAATALFALGMIGRRPIRSVSDATGEPLDGRRVRAAGVLALALATASLAWGRPDPTRAGALWPAFAALGLAGIAGWISAAARR